MSVINPYFLEKMNNFLIRYQEVIFPTKYIV